MDHVPETPAPEEGRKTKLVTIAEISTKYNISRQAVHRLRVRGVFPPPVSTEGSTRTRFDEDAVDAYFKANPKRQGRRIDLERKKRGKEATGNE